MTYHPRDVVPIPKPGANTPEENILTEAAKITAADRQLIYGSPKENWTRTAEIFNAMTGLKLTPAQAVQMAVAVKLARLQNAPNHRDSLVDLAGYAWVWSEVIK